MTEPPGGTAPGAGTGVPWVARSMPLPRGAAARPLFALTVLLLFLATLVPSLVAIVGVLPLLLALTLGWRVASWVLAVPEGVVEVRLEDAGVYLWRSPGGLLRGKDGGRTTLLRRRALRSARVVPEERGGSVVLRGRLGDRARLRFDDLAEARAFLDALGLGPRHRPMTFRFFFGLRVTVGVDGVVVAVPLLRRRRFVRYETIAEIQRSSTAVILRLAGGGTYEIATGAGEAQEALFERLLDATRTRTEADHAEPLVALRRAGRAPEAWVKELRVLGSQAPAGYRAATIPADTLWRLALDPTEKPELRIGATLALRGALDDAGRARLRVAAEAAASPRVRVALEATADAVDDEALAKALRRRG